jgi:hypothetical protein
MGEVDSGGRGGNRTGGSNNGNSANGNGSGNGNNDGLMGVMQGLSSWLQRPSTGETRLVDFPTFKGDNQDLSNG